MFIAYPCAEKQKYRKGKERRDYCDDRKTCHRHVAEIVHNFYLRFLVKKSAAFLPRKLPLSILKYFKMPLFHELINQFMEQRFILTRGGTFPLALPRGSLNGLKTL
jgi:hypothetical protein